MSPFAHRVLKGFSPVSRQEKSNDKEDPKSKEKLISNRKLRNCKKKTNPRQVSESTPEKYVQIFSANGAGCFNKIQSIVDNITHLNAGIVTLQETHFRQKGKLNKKLYDFEFFEAIRELFSMV